MNESEHLPVPKNNNIQDAHTKKNYELSQSEKAPETYGNLINNPRS